MLLKQLYFKVLPLILQFKNWRQRNLKLVPWKNYGSLISSVNDHQTTSPSLTGAKITLIWIASKKLLQLLQHLESNKGFRFLSKFSLLYCFEINDGKLKFWFAHRFRFSLNIENAHVKPHLMINACDKKCIFKYSPTPWTFIQYFLATQMQCHHRLSFSKKQNIVREKCIFEIHQTMFFYTCLPAHWCVKWRT